MYRNSVKIWLDLQTTVYQDKWRILNRLLVQPATQHGIVLALISLFFALRNLYYGLFECFYILGGLSFVLVLNLALSKRKSNVDFIFFVCQLLSIVIFYFSSYTGLNGGIYMYNLILLTASPFLFGVEHVSRIVILYLVILILFLVNYYTDFKIFFDESCSPAALEQGAFISPFIQTLIIAGINGVYVSKMLVPSATHISAPQNHAAEDNKNDCEVGELPNEENDFRHNLQSLATLALSNPETLVVQFNQSFPLFFDQLLTVNPKMTATEYKTLVLIKLGFATKDISSIEFISVRTVETRKNRIRKNFGLSPHTNIYIWLNAFSV